MSPSASVHAIVPDWSASSLPELESAEQTGASLTAVDGDRHGRGVGVDGAVVGAGT